MEAQPSPYAPPEAPVADIETAPAGPCAHVELACRLVWISFGVSILNTVVRIFTAQSGSARVGTIIGGVVGFGLGFAIWSWVTRKWRAGRNWMRWLYTGLGIVGWLSVGIFWSTLREAYGTMGFGAFSMLAMAVNSLIGIVVVCLLHTPTTRAWFRAQSDRA